ncbi:MAG TPA: FAD-binding oxidoreductase [Mycobacteriales bacterium]|jgi:alkyldihydroxyacetonephosphate synthase|nr:FAD-binding oxidoreductase [Mycobacteriales bacterium]
MSASTYPVWGWSRDAGDEPRTEDLEAMAPLAAQHLGLPVQPPERPAPLPALAADRVGSRLPAPLAVLASSEPLDRARHALGRSYRDVVRGIRGEIPAAPDVVLRPRNEVDVAAVLDWCSDARVAVVPYSGGTSVVGGVEPAVGDGYTGVASLDLELLAGVLEVDPVSRAARVAAGTAGPRLEDELRPHGLTARFFPQSFERSTVGGWVATRAAGHFSTRLTHIDDIVESVRAVTAAGIWESRRLPGSGAGPSPDRMLLGSEGTLGVVTETWLRVQPRPTHRWAATLAAGTFAEGAHAVRMLLHDGLLPATCRLIDAAESATAGTLATGQAALVLGFESYGGPVEASAVRALDVARDAGLQVVEAGDRGGAGEAWRSSFVRAPYVREQLVLLGLLVETFETAITWDRFDEFVAHVTDATESALRSVCGAGRVTCRLTHVYADGAAPYFTVMAPANRGSELAQWDEVKAAASEAIMSAGGTITHHHAVGRDHVRWYAAQRPEPFARAFAAAKAALDPAAILNPGVLSPLS